MFAFVCYVDGFIFVHEFIVELVLGSFIDIIYGGESEISQLLCGWGPFGPLNEFAFEVRGVGMLRIILGGEVIIQ